MQRALSAAISCVEGLREATHCPSCSSPAHPLWCAVCNQPLCACTAAQHQSHRHALLPNRQCAQVLARVRALCRWARLRPSSSSSPSHHALTLRVKPPPPPLRLTLRLRPPRSLPLSIRLKTASSSAHNSFSDRTTQTPPPLQQHLPPSSSVSPPDSTPPHSGQQPCVPTSPSPALRSNTPQVSPTSKSQPLSPAYRKSPSPQSPEKLPHTPSPSPSTVTKRPRSASVQLKTNSPTPLPKRRKHQQRNLLQQTHASEPLPLISNTQLPSLPHAQPHRNPSVTTISLQSSPQSKNNRSPQQSRSEPAATHPVPTPEKPLPHTPPQNDAADDKLSEGTTNPGGRDEADMEDPVTPLKPTSTARPNASAQSPPKLPSKATHQNPHSDKSEWNTTQSPRSTSPLTTLKSKQQSRSFQTPTALETKPQSSKQQHIHTDSQSTFFVCMSDFADQQQYDLAFELLTQMGAEPLPNLASTRPNCVITPLHPTTGAIQTRKMAVLLAIALRVPIVGLTWLVDCFNAGTWLPLQSYDASSSFHRSCSGVFKGVIATIDRSFEHSDASDKLLQFRNDIKRLITGADGVVVQLDHIKEYLETNVDCNFFLHIHIVKDQNEDEFVMNAQVADDKLDLIRKYQSSIGFTIVNMNWISECLFTGLCPPPERSETITRSTQSPTVSHSQGCVAPEST